MRRLTQSLPYLAAAVVGYLVPVALHPLIGGGTDGKALVFGSLLLLNPLVVAVAATLFTRRHAPLWWFPVLAAALFLPVALIPPLNSSAFVYAGLYLVAGAVGTGIGALLRGRSGQRAEGSSTASTVAG